MPTKLKDLIEHAISVLFYGEITITFNAGKIVGVKRIESIKM